MLFILVAALAIFGPHLGHAADWKLVWSDEFNNNSLSVCDWHYETGTGSGGWGNSERQFYTSRPENVKVQNGNLVFTVRVEDYAGSNFTSTRMLSNRAWTYGKFEARMRLPRGKHLWPAFWMLPTDWDYGFWVASGEIDILECRGEKPSVVEGTLHYGGSIPNNVYSGSGQKTFDKDFTADFHVFALEWETNEIRWLVDGQVYFRVDIDRSMWSGKGKNPYTKKGQPFDKPFYILLNVAVGGSFFPVSEYGPPVTLDEARRWPKNTLEVDYVRVYQRV